MLAVGLACVAFGFGGPLELRCPGGEQPFFPTGLAFGNDGRLFVTDARNGSVFRLDGESCVAIAEGWSRPYGVAALEDGRVCVGHFTSDDPLTREAVVSCWDGAAWALEVRDLDSGINGLAAGRAGLWVASWIDTPVERRDGRLTLLTAGGVARRVELPARLPQFSVELPSGDLLVTVWREDASGITAGETLLVSGDGSVSPAFDAETGLPSGIARSAEGIWIADGAAGALTLYPPEGRRSIDRAVGLATPLAIATDAGGNLCLADAGRGRIVCLTREDLLGKEMHHEE